VTHRRSYRAEPRLADEAFGFRVVPEWAFRIEVEAGGGLDSRLLDLANESDRALMHRLLERRAPLSPVLSLGREKCVPRSATSWPRGPSRRASSRSASRPSTSTPTSGLRRSIPRDRTAPS